MKSPLCVIRTGILTIALLAMGAQQGRSQSNCNEEVSVRLFPFDDTALQATIERNTSTVLTAINRQSYQRTTNISTDAAQKVVEEVMGKYCTRRRSYNGLLVPSLSSDATYEVRGLHLVSLDDGVTRHPQASLIFNREGLIIDVNVVDDSQRERDRETLRQEVVDVDRADEVLDLLLAIEAAYNKESPEEIISDLRKHLSNASIIVSRLSPTGRASNKYLTGDQYARNLSLAMKGRDLEVTFENIAIYPHLDENDEPVEDLYRVTVLQHWMYPDNGYQDTDYISLDIQFLPEPSASVRRAGRGGFTLETSPPGVKITQVNDSPASIKTPYFFENVPQQFHYVMVDDIWYETDIAIATPDQIAERDTIRLFMKHKPARLQIITTPTNTRLAINGMDHAGFQSGQTVTVPAAELLKALEAMDLEKEYPGTTRQVELLITSPYYQDLEQTVTIQTPAPIPLEFELARLKGDLNVGSTPSNSEVLINAEPAGLTPLSTKLEVTGDDRPPYKVSARNDTCFPVEEENVCRLHIPSVPEDVYIENETPTDLDIALTPFYVRNLTKDGDINVSLARQEGRLRVKYQLSDRKERRRKYRLQMTLLDENGEESAVPQDAFSCENIQVACMGNKVRPGSNGFAWPLNLPDGKSPVLTLSEKKFKWIYLLIPAAGGIVAATILLRDGGDGPDNTFTPPPRP